MSLKHGLLGLLNYGPMTGYDLDKAFKESLGYFWQAQTSQIYRELAGMEKLGWLSSELVLQTEKPNKKLYALTTPGKDELRRWLLSDSVEDDIRVRDPFLVKLFFSGEIGADESAATLKKYRACCESALAAMGATKATIAERGAGMADRRKPVYWGATASFGYRYYEMCIAWADEVLGRVEEME